MPLFEYKCEKCGKESEILILSKSETPECSACGSRKMTRQISAHSSMSGSNGRQMPGPGDTACCGSAPGQASGCAGPGSCCGKTF